MKNKLIILTLFTFLCIHSQENNFVREINPFPILHDGKLFSNIFSGGPNNPEFQFVDIDGDNDFDLFILSSDGSYELFENTGNKINPLFELSLELPQNLSVSDWFFFVDIDDDNDLDYFTGQKGSKVKYFENIGNIFSFSLLIDTVRNFENNDLNVETGSNPAFVDIDGDGDFDLICGNTSGTANYYQNIGTRSNFVFDSLDSEWQNLRVGIGKIVSEAKHGASSIEFVDIDHDGTQDLFWGDFFNTSLYLIRNNGTPQIPSMSIESRVYPTNSDSISTKGFNMPRFVDIDADGDLDLFTSILWNDPSLKESISFRENNGGNNFEFVSDNYLNLLDVGSRSIPDLVDIDADGDLDLFIGSESLNDGSIFFLENIGSSSNPIYELVDSNFFDIRGELSLSPTFGDLDNDGDFDLLVGSFSNDIIYFENTGNVSTPVFENRGVLQNSKSENIKGGIYIRCRLIDVDFDGDLDLTIGNFSGQVHLYKNIGNQFSYSFELDENYFNILKPGNYTNASLLDYDNDSINELFIGTSAGNILLYENDNNVSPNFTLIDEQFLNYNFGTEPNLVFSDIENDGDGDFIIGNIKGGLYFFRNNLISEVIDKPLTKNLEISISSYPNPFNGSVQIEVRVPNNIYYSLKIFNILGEEVSLLYRGISFGDAQTFVWNTNNVSTQLSSGTYIISVQSETSSKNLPVLLIK